MPMPETQTEIWPMQDLVKHWLHEKLTVVTKDYDDCAKKITLEDQDIRRFRSSCIVLYIHLKKKIARNAHARTEEEKEIIDRLEKIRIDPRARSTKSIDEEFRFWTSVFSFFCDFMDEIGITKVDQPRVPSYVKMMKGMDAVG